LQNAWVNWLWFIDADADRLVLKLADNIEFPTEIKAEQTNGYCQPSIPFSAQDAELYSAFREILTNSELSQQGQFTVAINATAACSYLIPIPAKSWLYQPSQCVFNKSVGDRVNLIAEKEAEYLVLEQDECSAVVILMDEQHKLNENRCLQQGQVIRVHNDRLKRL
jgi:hypothetical protein